ncbi:hypothetical protein ACFO1B_52805 [Dactylosporangium siamense]|uniref:vWA-MoxR associated protein C-terminal domain-containing protein n=1 Tax=Dactylosporangium siamense TaxID=685454 RepID=A0A919PXN0_9ACTN|nr:hypothetical protein [Dactylosporangium siamense]GIG50528.1 hypothetical protein Dsi01nite_085690 [Dactylosporangium siamense]
MHDTADGSADLARALAGVPELAHPLTFREFTLLLTEQLGIVVEPPARTGDREARCRSLVDSCVEKTGTPRRMPGVVLDVMIKLLGEEGDSVERLRDAVERIGLAFVFDDAQIHELDQLLMPLQRHVDLTQVADVLEQVLSPYRLTPPGPIADLASLVRSLEPLRYVGDRSTPPVLLVIGALSACLDARGEPLRRWAERAAEPFGGLPDQPWTRLIGKRLRLVIRVAQTRRSGAPVSLDGWFRTSSGKVMGRQSREHGPHCGPRYPMCCGQKLLGQLAQKLPRDDAAAMTVEFVLPWTLLDHPVEGWTANEVYRTPIGEQHPVVVRPLERVIDGVVWESVLTRWARFDAANRDRTASAIWLVRDGHRRPPGAAYINEPADAKQLASMLRDREDVSCLCLAYPFNHARDSSGGGVHSAIAAGVPVVLWLRDRSDPAPLEALVRETGMAGSLDGLPGAVRKYRIRAAADNDSQRSMVLVWDDPNQPPEPEGPLQPPSQRHRGTPQ